MDSYVIQMERDKGNVISVTDAFLKVKQHNSQSVLMQRNIFIHPRVRLWSVGRREGTPHKMPSFSVTFLFKLQGRVQTVSVLKVTETKNTSPVLPTL